jgi:hypothetical protein
MEPAGFSTKPINEEKCYGDYNSNAASATDIGEIQRVLDNLQKAHYEKNAAIAASYAADATLFTLVPPLEHRGMWKNNRRGLIHGRTNRSTVERRAEP